MAHTSPLRSTEPGSAALDVDVGAPVAVPEVEPVLELEPELEAVLVPAGLVAVGEPDGGGFVRLWSGSQPVGE